MLIFFSIALAPRKAYFVSQNKSAHSAVETALHSACFTIYKSYYIRFHCIAVYCNN